MNAKLTLTPYTKLSKVDYISKCKTTKLLEENIAEILHDLGLDKEFIDITVKPQSIKEKTD